MMGGPGVQGFDPQTNSNYSGEPMVNKDVYKIDRK